MSSTLQTGHIGLNVTNLEDSSNFYRQVFGFQVLNQSLTEGRRFAFLGNEKSLVLTLWEQSQGQFAKANPGLHHLSFQVDSIEEVEQAKTRLEKLGARFIYEGIVPHAEGADDGGIYFEDPDGIRLEIFSPVGAGSQPAPVADGPSCGFF